MIQAIFNKIEIHNFQKNPSLLLDLDRLEHDEEGYFLSPELAEPMLKIELSNAKRIGVELCYIYEDMNLHLPKLELILEKSKSFLLPSSVEKQEWTVEIRLERSLAISARAVAVDEQYYKNAMKEVINELFAVLTLY